MSCAAGIHHSAHSARSAPHLFPFVVGMGFDRCFLGHSCLPPKHTCCGFATARHRDLSRSMRPAIFNSLGQFRWMQLRCGSANPGRPCCGSRVRMIRLPQSPPAPRNMPAVGPELWAWWRARQNPRVYSEVLTCSAKWPTTAAVYPAVAMNPCFNS